MLKYLVEYGLHFSEPFFKCSSGTIKLFCDSFSKLLKLYTVQLSSFSRRPLLTLTL